MSKFLPVRLFFVWLLFGILLAGCGNSPSSDEEPPVYSPARVLTPEAPGKKTLGSSPLILDISNQDQGYLTAESDSDDSRMNIQLTVPSGVVYSRQTLEQLAAILEKKEAEYGHPIYLISDEPYREIAFAGVEVPWIPHIYKDTIVCYSFSKSLSLPGERLGYVLVPGQVTDSKEVYAAVAGAGRSLGYVNAPSLFQQVTSLCCDMTSDLSVYEKNCELLVNSLREMGYHVAQPGGAFYLFPRSLEPDDMAFSERAKQFDLLLVPGSGFGAPGHFRLAYCVQTEMIQRALPKFKALADSYGG